MASKKKNVKPKKTAKTKTKTVKKAALKKPARATQMPQKTVKAAAKKSQKTASKKTAKPKLVSKTKAKPAAKAKSKPQAKGLAKPKAGSKPTPSPVKPQSKAAVKPIIVSPKAAPAPVKAKVSVDKDYMNAKMLKYFRLKLESWREEILRETQTTLQHLQEETVQEADLTDRASTETDRALELRARDRQRKLIAKIDAALARIADGSYGYCEETGEPIGFKRLDARPIATLSIEAQERHERHERTHRDDLEFLPG